MDAWLDGNQGLSEARVIYTVECLQPVALPLDAQCNPVHAYQFNKANTIFQVARAAGKTTAWIDKGPYYELVQVRPALPPDSLVYQPCDSRRPGSSGCANPLCTAATAL